MATKPEVIPIRQDNTSTMINHQYIPVSYKSINANKVSEVISSPSITRQVYSSPIDQLRNINSAYTSPSKEIKPNQTINWDDYEKIESDGRTIYRKKVKIEQQKQFVNDNAQPIKQSPRDYNQIPPSVQNSSKLP